MQLKIISVFWLFLMISPVSFAQDKGIGIKAGFNFSRIEGQDIVDPLEGRIGYQFGIMSNMSISDRVYFGPEIIAMQKGTQDVELLYFKSPLLFRYFFTDKMHIDFGPYAAYLHEASAGEVIIEGEFQTLDLGGSFGIGGYIGIVNIDLRFHRGFKDTQKDDSKYLIAQEGEVDAANTSIELSIGYLF